MLDGEFEKLIVKMTDVWIKRRSQEWTQRAKTGYEWAFQYRDRDSEKETIRTLGNERRNKSSKKLSWKSCQQIRLSRRLPWSSRTRETDLNIRMVLKKIIRNYDQNRWELGDNIKRPNIRLTGPEKGAEIQVNGTGSLFRELIAESIPHLGVEMDIQILEEFRITDRQDQKRASPLYITITMPKFQEKKK